MIKVSKYTDDNGVLAELDGAEFLNGKLKAGNTLDFAGVQGLAPAFLDVLFKGLKPEPLVEQFTGIEGAVDEALTAWLERTPVSIPSKPMAHKKAAAPAPKPAAPPPEFDVPAIDGDRFTPTRLATRLEEQLRRYIESAYPLNDGTLIKARRKLLQEMDDGHLLAQEPFVETTAQYRRFRGTYADLGLPPEATKILSWLTQTPTDHEPDRKLLFKELYEHQAKAFTAFLRDGRDLVVATGTGSGKTECFLVPMVARLYEEAVRRPASFAKRGVRCLILYPMNALVNDQLARLRLLVGSERLAAEFHALTPGARQATFGMYTGRTPYPGPRDGGKDAQRVAPLLKEYLEMSPALAQELKRLGRFPAKDLEAFYGEDRTETGEYKTGKKKKGKQFTKHHWPERLRTGPADRELLTRQEMIHDPETGQGASPDILVTNYSMLEYMLMRPFERPIFQETKEWLREPDSQLLLVLDEAHMYRGAKGAEIAFLIRRLLARLDLLDKPEKLAVICTSASLGGGDAVQTAKKFAADLTGKRPERFEVILGDREQPEPVGEGDESLAQALAAVPLEALHADVPAVQFSEALLPLLQHLGHSGPAPEDVPRRLHELLAGRPWVNKVLACAGGQARPLQALAKEIFPSCESGLARRALETLLAVGTLARPKPGEPSLVPTRIHMMFRGLAGLYACINPRCTGRQERPGEEAPLGKLFATPHTRCDACDARVFEVASCRSCGGAYLLAYTPAGQVAKLDFLWGEMEGELETVQVLPTRPRHEEGIEEVAVHLSTGQVLSAAEAHGREGLRPVWLSYDQDQKRRETTFPRCPLCQPARSQRRSRIADLRTKGEQPFTTLVETQFAEQPPQKNDPRLPNRGRKVLVFSDGRQRAARLAPALETSHSSDAFRQVLLLAADALVASGKSPRVTSLYPAVLKICTQRGVDLFPAADETQFHTDLANARQQSLDALLDLTSQGILQPPLSYAQALYAELTNRYFSLSAMGLATIEEEPALNYVFTDFPAVGLSTEEIRHLVRGWIRLQLERRCFLPPGASPGQLGDQWDRPEGIDLARRNDIVSMRLEELLVAQLGPGDAKKVADWFTTFVHGKGFLQLLNNFYYLKAPTLVLRPRLRDQWLRCRACSRLELHTLKGRCFECQGEMVAVEEDALYLDARYGYYRDQVARAMRGDSLEPFGLTTEEHSAQLTGQNDDDAFTRTEVYELRFQDVRVDDEPPIDVLSCTTTMEVGIDIGALTGVALRNVPPHVANYQQRAGRAGRRGRTIASVITYAQGGSHDAWYYDHPEKIISGDVRSPVVYTQNEKVLERHINAYLLQVFFHETVAENAGIYQLFASLGSVREFLIGDSPCTLEHFEAWTQQNKAQLEADLRAWVPSFSHGFGVPLNTQAAIDSAIDRLVARLKAELPVALARQTAPMDERQQEALETQLDELLLQTLIDRAILPRYAFPTDTVTFWVPEQRKVGVDGFKRNFDYRPQRDLQIALSEYAPGRSLTIDKFRFESAALYSPYRPSAAEMLDEARAYTACKTCGYVSLSDTTGVQSPCPACGQGALSTRDFVRPDGFAPDINKRREIDRGGAITYAGMSTPAKLEVQKVTSWDDTLYDQRLRALSRPQTLVVVNKGIGDRGFIVCPTCGASEPVFGQGFTEPRLLGRDGKAKVHLHPTELGVSCTGTALGPYYLGHQFPTDVLLLRLRFASPMRCMIGDRPAAGASPAISGRAGRSALTSLVEALCLAASRTLQIDEGELAGNWNPVLGQPGTEADLYLYDLLPGGAGYTRQARENLGAIFEEARAFLKRCDCVSSCHRCLRHYGNQFTHGALDRHLALALLDYVLDGRVPTVDPAVRDAALRPLVELLELRRVKYTLDAAVPDQATLRVRLGGVDTWVNVHHPLVDPEAVSSPVVQAAESLMQPVVSLDPHVLVYDLPAAFQKLTAHVKA